MSEQNRYQVSYAYYKDLGPDWFEDRLRVADTWQDAIYNWLEERFSALDYSYQVVSETPSEDGRSGIMEITDDPQLMGQVKATIIE